MAFMDLHLLTQTIVYAITVCSSLVVGFPVGLVTMDFHGGCLLYGKIELDSDKNHFTFHFGSSSTCQFIIWSAILTMLYALAMMIYYAYATHKSRQNSEIGYSMWVMPYILVSALVILIILISAGVLNMGFHMWCSAIVNALKGHTCQDATKLKWYQKGTGTEYVGGHFYKYYKTASLAVWVVLLCWVVQLVLCIVRFVRNRRQRSDDVRPMVSDDAIVSA